MALFAETTINDLIEARRIDAEFFKYQDIVNAVERLNPTEIGEYSSWITQGPNPKFSNEGYDCLTGRNIADGSLTYEGSDKVDEEEFNAYKRFHLQENDILITLKGAGSTGKVGIYRKEKPAMFSRNLGIIRIKKETFHPFYFYTFLNSQHGQKLIDRLVTGGTGQLTLATSALKRLKIPVFEKKIQEITNKITKHFELQEKSKSFYSQAKQLLLQELELEDFMPEWVAGYETDYNNILEVARMDAEYFQPRYKVIKERIRAVNHDALENLVKPLQKGIEVGSEAYTDKGVPFMRISNISAKTIDYGSAKYISKELFDQLKDKYCPKQGEILLSKDGTPGIAYHVMSEIEAIICGGIVRLKSTKLEPEYLALVLNSRIVQSQIEQEAGGALIKHWRSDQIRKTLIPILSKEKREKINTLVKDSFSALHESRQLLEQAKKEVEEMIESKAR